MYFSSLKLIELFNILKLILQLPTGSLRTFDVTHSRLVTHFRILKHQKKFYFFNIGQIEFIVYF